MSQHIVASGRPAGDGWKNVAELIPIMGRARQTIRPMMVRLARSGDVEQAAGTNELGRPCVYFRPAVRSRD